MAISLKVLHRLAASQFRTATSPEGPCGPVDADHSTQGKQPKPRHGALLCHGMGHGATKALPGLLWLPNCKQATTPVRELSMLGAKPCEQHVVAPMCFVDLLLTCGGGNGIQHKMDNWHKCKNSLPSRRVNHGSKKLIFPWIDAGCGALITAKRETKCKHIENQLVFMVVPKKKNFFN